MFYTENNLNMSGKDFTMLKQVCESIDEHTTIQKLNYYDCDILHYLQMGKAENNDGEKIYVLAIQPGKQLLVHEIRGIPQIIASSIGTLSLSKMEQTGALCMLDNFIKNKTAFMFQGDRRKDIVFVSDAAKKTMGVRLPVPDSNSSIERDLLLAKKIGDCDYMPELYTVMRSASRYHLAIGFFFHDPKRESWSRLLEFAESLGIGKCLSWHVEQSRGLEFLYQYQDEVNEIKQKYPDCRYEPCHIFRTCDSGHISDMVSTAWLDPGSTDIYFITENHKLKGSWNTAIKESFACHKKDAESICLNASDYISSNEEMVSIMASAMDAADVQGEAGVKAQRRFTQYISEQYFDNMKRLDCRDLVIKAFRDGIFASVSPYADWIMKEKCSGRIIKNI